MKKGFTYYHSCESENLIIPRKEILRYMSCKDETQEIKNLIDENLSLVTEALSLKGSFVYLPIEALNGEVLIADKFIKSKNLFDFLCNCSGAVVFALSCGSGIDYLIEKHSRLRPSAAFCIDAIATAAIESYADKFCTEISQIFHNKNMYTRSRFSPGYGDFLLENQSFFLKITNAYKHLGITLTDNFLMMPSKSITAVMGVGDDKLINVSSGCKACTQKKCQYRR